MEVDKQHILDEIKRLARINNGAPLGRKIFERDTGIRTADWYGKYWARWSDAVLEAGLSPNTVQEAYDDTFLIEKMISFIRELRHCPVGGELRIKARSGKGFPNEKTLGRFGSPKQFAARIIEYCRERGGYDDVIEICLERCAREDRPTQFARKPRADEREVGSAQPGEIGFVYLLKSGAYYKIGKTNAAGRRERELAIQLPEKAATAHVIKTDDPTGIEAYWHRRFEAKRKHGEWFELDGADVKAFKRRNFM